MAKYSTSLNPWAIFSPSKARPRPGTEWSRKVAPCSASSCNFSGSNSGSSLFGPNAPLVPPPGRWQRHSSSKTTHLHPLSPKPEPSFDSHQPPAVMVHPSCACTSETAAKRQAMPKTCSSKKRFESIPRDDSRSTFQVFQIMNCATSPFSASKAKNGHQDSEVSQKELIDCGANRRFQRHAFGERTSHFQLASSWMLNGNEIHMFGITSGVLLQFDEGVDWQNDWDGGHSVVVIGYNRDKMSFLDPPLPSVIFFRHLATLCVTYTPVFPLQSFLIAGCWGYRVIAFHVTTTSRCWYVVCFCLSSLFFLLLFTPRARTDKQRTKQRETSKKEEKHLNFTNGIILPSDYVQASHMTRFKKNNCAINNTIICLE